MYDVPVCNQSLVHRRPIVEIDMSQYNLLHVLQLSLAALEQKDEALWYKQNIANCDLEFTAPHITGWAVRTGKGQISTTQRAKTHEAILMKLCPRPHPHDIFGGGSATWVVWACDLSHLAVSFLFCFLRHSPR